MTVRNWFRPTASNKPVRPARPSPRPRLAVEQLEARDVPTAVGVPDGLVSWWTANNTATDATGLNNAALTNVSYTTGEVGRGWNFNGANGWASLGDPSSLAFTGSFSIEGWVKVNGLPAGYNFGSIVFRGDNRGGLDPYQLVITPTGNLQFLITGAPGTATAGSPAVEAPIPTGQWVHVAATLDDATGAMTLYENGAAVARTTTPARPFGPLDPTQNPGVGIGNSNYLYNYNVPLNGVVDELAMYSRSLSAGEVYGIAKAGPSGKVFSPVAIDAPSVVEGAAGTTTPVTFTLRRTGGLSGSLTASWATGDDAATAGSDYVAASGTVTFAPGEATQAVSVQVTGDATVEPNETFRLVVTPAGGTAIMGFATIINDDASVSVADAAAVEGSTAYRYVGTLTGPNQYGLAAARNIAYGADGNLYVASHDTDNVLVIDPATGNLVRTFTTPGGELDGPWGMTFGPDGKLYVGGRYSQNVVRFDIGTGAYGVFVPTNSGGLGQARGLAFGPDGNLYATSTTVGVTDPTLDTVKRFDGATGAPLGDFVAAGSGGGSDLEGLAFGPDGNLYVGSVLTNDIKRYDGRTGAFLSNFVPAGSGGLAGPRSLVFRDGALYVTGGPKPGFVYRFSAATGAFVDQFSAGPAFAGVNGANDIAFAPDGEMYGSIGTATLQSGSYVARFAPASFAAFTVSLPYASALPVTVSYSTADGTARAGADYVATVGTLTFAPGETTKIALVPTVNDSVAEATETFTLALSNPVGATITSGPGTGTVTDDDFTKFYTVDDGSADRTYRYGVPGNGLGTTALAAGDTAPRGVATTAAGDKVWVADANKTVYVYSAAGALLGSWAAGGLPSNAQVEGVATNGTDVWLLDNRQDKVYKYAGAATRLSGSQSPASSFGLYTYYFFGLSGNTNGKGIVTDGASLWVVDDGSSSDTVYKYTLSGALLGSWTIDPANASPTGITLNPAAVSDLWIVDNGTDRVYQYTAAAGRTSGSQSASATFALAPGDTNPQDIADPPPGLGEPIPLASPAVAAWPAEPVAGSVRGVPATDVGAAGRRGPAAASVADPILFAMPDRSASAGEARPADPAGVAADWLVADDFDLSPVVVDPVWVLPRRR